MLKMFQTSKLPASNVLMFTPNSLLKRVILFDFAAEKFQKVLFFISVHVKGLFEGTESIIYMHPT